MDAWVGDLAPLVVGWAVTVGPIGGLVALLNRRDRRQAELYGRVAARLAPEAIRSDVAIDVACRLASRRAVVRLDMRGCSQEAIWDAVARVGDGLPPEVRLLVEGRLSRQRSAQITVEARGTAPFCHVRA